MGCCGSKANATTEYEVTFRDGTTTRVATLGEARVKARTDTSTDPGGLRKAATFRAVPKSRKTA